MVRASWTRRLRSPQASPHPLPLASDRPRPDTAPDRTPLAQTGDGGGSVKYSFKAVGVIGLFAVLAVTAAGCGGGGGSGSSSSSNSSGGGGNVQALPTSSCSSIYYEGSGDADFIVASDLPLQGAGRAQTTEMVQAIKFALKQRGFKAGKYNVAYQSCDDSTAQAGAWDSAKCASNGRAYASNKAVIGVVGTFNSGCAKIIVPILNRAVPG